MEAWNLANLHLVGECTVTLVLGKKLLSPLLSFYPPVLSFPFSFHLMLRAFQKIMVSNSQFHGKCGKCSYSWVKLVLWILPWNNALRDAGRRLYQGVLYFQNVIRCQDTRLRAISFTPVREARRPFDDFHKTRQCFSSIVCGSHRMSPKSHCQCVGNSSLPIPWWTGGVLHSRLTRLERATELWLDTDLIFLTYSAKLVLPYVFAGNGHTT